MTTSGVRRVEVRTGAGHDRRRKQIPRRPPEHPADSLGMTTCGAWRRELQAEKRRRDVRAGMCRTYGAWRLVYHGPRTQPLRTGLTSGALTVLGSASSQERRPFLIDTHPRELWTRRFAVSRARRAQTRVSVPRRTPYRPKNAAPGRIVRLRQGSDGQARLPPINGGRTIRERRPSRCKIGTQTTRYECRGWSLVVRQKIGRTRSG